MRYLLEWGEGLTGQKLEDELAKVNRANQLIDQPELFCREFPLDCQRNNGIVYMWGQSAKFWKEIAELDPLESLRRLKCSVFAIHGTSDWVVSSTEDGGAIARALSKSANFSFKNLDGLDHFLARADSKKASVEIFKRLTQGEKINLEMHSEYISEIGTVLQKWIQK